MEQGQRRVVIRCVFDVLRASVTASRAETELEGGSGTGEG